MLNSRYGRDQSDGFGVANRTCIGHDGGAKEKNTKQPVGERGGGVRAGRRSCPSMNERLGASRTSMGEKCLGHKQVWDPIDWTWEAAGTMGDDGCIDTIGPRCMIWHGHQDDTHSRD